MKLSASIYSYKGQDLGSIIHELDACKVNYFHMDCDDNLSVFEDIKKIRQLSKTPIDLHLITSTPEKFFAGIIENKIESVTFQYENLKNKIVVPEEITSDLGLSVTSDTPILHFEPYKDRFSHILFMTTTPGQSGGSFNKNNFKKIQAFRSLYEDKKIHVDGGINEEISFILRNMGVYVAVIGSYLFKNDYIGSAILNLKSDNIESHFKVRDFMIEFSEIPKLQMGDFDFYKVLTTIDQFKMGFCAVIHPNGDMGGIITNADIRKSLIRNISDINNIKVEDMINRTPAFVYDDNTVSEILNYIKTLKFPVLFLPVLTRDKKLIGTLKFNNLIKGEL